MNDQERKQRRRQRRIAVREEKKEAYSARYNDFSHIIDPNTIYEAFKKSRIEVTWKESVQRYEMNLFRNINQTRKKLIKGENIGKGFVEFDLMERGRLRHIKSVHISERVVQKTLCDHILVPMLSRSLIYDNGASIKGKGLHFAIRRLMAHLSRFYRENTFSNDGYCLSIDFSKYFDSIRIQHASATRVGLILDTETTIRRVRDGICFLGRPIFHHRFVESYKPCAYRIK
jgi:hypothetical protein